MAVQEELMVRHSANLRINTLVQQFESGMILVKDAVSSLLKGEGEFACKDNLEIILESIEIMNDDFCVFMAENKF